MRKRRTESGSSLIWFLSVYTRQFAALTDGQTDGGAGAAAAAGRRSEAEGSAGGLTL